MSLQVHLVNSRSLLKAFQRFPWRVYRDYPQWVPPLLSQERALLVPGTHPFHEHARIQLFLATRDGQPVGRVGACVNDQHNVFHGERVGFFGFFECVDDQEVARALLEECKTWLRAHGMEAMRGPCNWSTNESCGLLVDGFQYPPMVMMPYNPPYYQTLLEASGLVKVKDLFSFSIDTSKPEPERVARVAARAMQRLGITFRTVNMKRLREEIERIREIYNAAWSQNWGFVPMTVREFSHLAHELKSIVDPRLVIIAEKGTEPVAFALSLPNVNRVLARLNGTLFPFGFLKALWYGRRIPDARLLTLGVKQEFRRKGIEAVLILESYRRGREAGYLSGEVGWVLEDNRLMISDIEAAGGIRYKTCRIYQVAL